jgi:DNA mismatch endonuclease (patch repair protein)
MPLVKCRMDRLSVAGRSRQMSLVKSKNTKPELAARKLVFSMGYRYRLHGAGLPGKPDLVFARRKKVVFVHGCFWHRHAGCKKATTPASNMEYWLPKFARTVERDQQTLDSLQALGWSALVVWECELKDTDALAEKLRAFLDN